MVDNYDIKSEEFQNLFGSAKRKKELAATKAELEAVKANQQVLQDTLAQQRIMGGQADSSSMGQDSSSKPNLLLWGGVLLAVVVGGILFINRK